MAPHASRLTLPGRKDIMRAARWLGIGGGLSDLEALTFAAVGMAGAFRFLIDEVRFEP